MQTLRRQSPISIKPSPKTPATRRRMQGWQMPTPYCLSTGANPSEDTPKAKAAALKALELDSTLARAHVNLGGIKMAHEWDFAGGEAEFKKALELDPNDAHAHQRYANNLGVIGGREQEALAEINRAHQLDPMSLAIRADLAPFTLRHDSTTRPLPCARNWQMRTQHSPERTNV